MEVIKSSYRILFSIAFELEGASYDLNPYLKLVPPTKTSDLIVRCKMLSRNEKSCFVSLIEVVADGVTAGKPKAIPHDDEVFRFQIKLTDKNFIKRTNISSLDFLNNVVYLSNTVNNVSGSELLLTQNAFVANADLQLRSSFAEGIDYDTFFVLDIKHSSTLNAPYKLLDASSKCREVSYKIKMKKA